MSADAGARGAERYFPLALVLAVACVFGRSLGFGFVVWDDPANLGVNPAFDPPTLASLAGLWTRAYEHLYVPVAYSLWWGLALFSRACFDALEPALFHGANLALHALGAVLVQRWLARLVADPRAAFAGALLFALHPLQAESVCWASELRGLACTALGFGALLELLRERRAPAALLFALALLAKPMALAFLPLALLQELGFRARPLPATLRALWAWGACAAACALVTSAVQPAGEMRFVTPLAQRPAVAFDALGFYLSKLVLPVGLCADYGRSPQSVLASLELWPAALALGCALALVLAFPERRRAACALAWFVLALLPVLGFVPFGYQEKSTVADRYAALALAGAALFVALLVRRLGARAFAGALLAAAACGVLACVQAGTWRDTRRLFERVLEIQPQSATAHDNLAIEALQRRDFEGAREHYRREVELEPRNALAWSNLGACESDLGRFEEGLLALRRAIELAPQYVRARANLVTALGRLGRLEEAEREARELLRIGAGDVEAELPLALVLRARGRDDEAEKVLRDVLARRPGWKPALAELEALGRR